MPRLITRLIVVTSPGRTSQGMILAGTARFRCALGRHGVVSRKREGDGGTPRGALRVRRMFYRADRMPRPRGLMPLRAIRDDDAWCDTVADRRYNRLIRLPVRHASEERLKRADAVYDIIVELGWNDAPVRKGRGSAIFWHVARPGFTPTAGCVATARSVFHRLLPRLARRCVLCVR
jgi:L,D-peptidoglycan transpeptidase YkuD (ErfK/YbiS/YcfS/YnhG family)